MASQASRWPGEWHPARNDVALASEAPDPAHLADFKTRLLASEDARGVQSLMHVDLSSRRSNNEYTYPMALLSQLPPIPEHFELGRLWQKFLEHRHELTFLASVPMSSESRETAAPFLLLAGASFALLSGGEIGRAREAFLASIILWSAMLEIDNREARTEDALVTGMLLCLYSSLDSDAVVERWSKMSRYAVATIARRRRIHDYLLLDDHSALKAHRSTTAALWLADLLVAVHLDAAMNFSTQEVNIDMIKAPYSLRDLRGALLKNKELPLDFQSRDDALLVLIALLTDAIYLQRSLNRWAGHPDPVNPYVPLSPYTEHQRMLSTISSALDKCVQCFKSVDPDILAFYYYCRLYVSFPGITSLAASIGYPRTIKSVRLDVQVPNTAAKFAWQILDTAAAANAGSGTNLHAPWLPVIVFHAGLTIWADIATCTSAYAPSKRILVSFILELQKMNWPCCATMASTLEALMS